MLKNNLNDQKLIIEIIKYTNNNFLKLVKDECFKKMIHMINYFYTMN